MNVYRKAVIHVSTVKRWVNSNPREKGEPDLSERQHSVRPAAAMNEDMAQQADTLITTEEKELLLQN